MDLMLEELWEMSWLNNWTILLHVKFHSMTKVRWSKEGNGGIIDVLLKGRWHFLFYLFIKRFYKDFFFLTKDKMGK